MTTRKPVIVVGAGVSGLTTGIVLLEAGYRVRIVAERVPGETSSAAGAMWGPYLVEPRTQVMAWSLRSLAVFRGLAVNQATGVRLTRGVEAARIPRPAADWARSLPDFQPCPASQLPAGFVEGHRFTAPVLDMPVYLEYLRSRFVSAGGRIETGTVRTLDAGDPHAVLVNCAGFGARSLVPDPDVTPTRGQHVVVDNPGITEFFTEDSGASPDLLCVYPQGDRVMLGGTAVVGDESLDADPAVAQAIVDRCAQVFPALATARVRAHRVGVRPGRSRVRVEAEQRPSGKLVVHNYGHGGAGVTLSWGCAEHVRFLLERG